MDSSSKYLLILYFMTIVSSRQIEASQEDPSSIILGLESGQILRCQLKDAQKCIELKSEDDYVITALAVSGEFVYIGSDSCSLQRCSLNHEAANKTCVTFQNTVSEINGLSISGKYIYAGLSEGAILQCGLRKSETCSLFYSTDSSVHSLVASDDYVYAGLEYEMIRCSLDEYENCTTLYNATSAVTGLVISRGHIYSSLREGEVWRCDLDATNCSLMFTAESEIEAIDVFDEYLHVIFDSGVVQRCYLENNESCSTIMSRNESRISSMVSIYATTGLIHHYRGESKGCVWQMPWRCPPYVNYYNIEDRVAFELHIKNNAVYSSNGNVFDTSKATRSFTGRRAIFVMDPTGRIYASNKQVIGLLHHSSLLAGNPVSAAGEMKIIKGIIEEISTCSGHYRPSVKLTKQIEISLKNKGYERNVTVRGCFDWDLLMDLNFNKLDLYYTYDLKRNIEPVDLSVV